MPIRPIVDYSPCDAHGVQPQHEPEALRKKKLEQQKKDPAWDPNKYPHKQIRTKRPS
jgi:hypothetical protein